MGGYVITFGVAVVARLLLVFFPVDYVSAGQRAVWSWGFFPIFALCFAVAVFLATRTRLPTPEETASGPKQRWLLPLAVGAAVALLTIWSDVISPAAQARGLTTIHVRGWAALPFYTYGAILLTVVFHFLPIALVAGLAQRSATYFLWHFAWPLLGGS